ncbi:MAG TPA: hypothetical protein VN253_04545 [Kofleriaceae bacterium]|nr:hypothetical protein [Kofleriaceae bacterium]
MHRAVSFASIASILVGLTLAASPASAAPDKSDPDAAAQERAKLREELAAQRKINLERFHTYRVTRVYPHNLYEEGKKNVWKDPDGHLCAVATMMDKGGQHDLVERTAEDQNFVRIADLSSGSLVDWVLLSGLTQEEIVMIQQPTEADIRMMEAAERRAKRQLARRLRREDNRLEANYIAIEGALKQAVMVNASLDLAAARLAERPDLVKALHTRTAELAEQQAAAVAAKKAKQAPKAKKS